MKRILSIINIFFLLTFSHTSLANSGLFFNVSATGQPADANITLCLNGKGPLSCQDYTVSALRLNVLTTIPNHVYSSAGIKINTPGYSIANSGIDCTPYLDGYCLFSVSDQTSATLFISRDNGYIISGENISGLTANGLILQDNGGDNLSVPSGAASFQFPTRIVFGGSYNVTIFQQPTGLTCTVNNGSGTNVMSDVTNIGITCSTISFSIGGSISGLIASGLILQNNGSDELSVASSATSFLFATPVAFGGSYNVTVLQQPTGLTCVVANGSGTNVMSDVTNVNVSCS